MVNAEQTSNDLVGPAAAAKHYVCESAIAATLAGKIAATLPSHMALNIA